MSNLEKKKKAHSYKDTTQFGINQNQLKPYQTFSYSLCTCNDLLQGGSGMSPVA